MSDVRPPTILEILVERMASSTQRIHENEGHESPWASCSDGLCKSVRDLHVDITDISKRAGR